MKDIPEKVVAIEAASKEEAFDEMREAIGPPAVEQLRSMGPSVILHTLFMAVGQGEDQGSRSPSGLILNLLENAECKHSQIVRDKLESIFESDESAEYKASRVLAMGIMCGILAQLLAGDRGPIAGVMMMSTEEFLGMRDAPVGPKKGVVN